MFAQRCLPKVAILLLISTIVPYGVDAQKGTATPGYYPSAYNGDIFTGELVPSVDPNQIKLVYKKGSKTESFEGKIESPCHAPTKDKPREVKELHLSAIPAGTILTAYYTPTTLKVEGNKVHANLVLGIRLGTGDGQKLNNPGRPIIFCSNEQALRFRAFN